MHSPIVHVLLPIIGALIGWLTNRLAVKMLFRPHRPRRILGLRIQGLVPRRQAELARRIAETVESRLLGHRDIEEGLRHPRVRAEIERSIDVEVERFFTEKLGTNPVATMILQGDVAATIKKNIAEQLKKAFPALLDHLIEQLQDQIDLKAIVQRKVDAFDLGTLEGIVYTIASRELKLIEILGGVLGFVVGLGQVGLLLLSGSGG